MPTICPTITAEDNHDYRAQMELISPFAKRVHIDLMDGQFAPSRSPELNQTWWPDNITADIHLMYKFPESSLDTLISLHPSLVVWHYEAEVDHLQFAARLRDNGIKVGLALLQQTSVDDIKDLLPNFDHVLIFSGHLGYHGGEADLSLLDKVQQIKDLNLDIEIAWDGGINETNARQLIDAGVSVLNVGGYIHSSSSPASAYATLEALAV
jgi:ribulose-phosphate 3-epimerase